MKHWISRIIGRPEAIDFFTSDKCWAPNLASFPESNRYTIHYYIYKDQLIQIYAGRRAESGSKGAKF